jgi:phospholipase C
MGEIVFSMVMRIGACLVGVLLGLSLTLVAIPERSTPGATNPIQHVVVIYMENQSFDGVLGQLCIRDQRPNCAAASQGKISNGTTIQLQRAPDLVPPVAHGPDGQLTAINGGKMDGFDRINGCKSSNGYACYAQYYPGQIPNTAALARKFAISDHTFELRPVASWVAHLSLVTATVNGFYGDNPDPAPGVDPGPGWGCNSNKVATWRSSPTSAWIKVPSCVPDKNGNGPFTASPVKWVPTIMDRMNQATPPVTWKIYSKTLRQDSLYRAWGICPTFADCLYTSQKDNVVEDTSLLTDAQNGTLPNVSIVIPKNIYSQHNGFSMLQGDNWIGSVVSELMNGPQWSSTAIFLTYDDCGCFYDHVAPPQPGLGIRIPMIIISPYAKSGYTDNAVASPASILAYIEHTFALPPLRRADQNAYDYSNSFDYTQSPLGSVSMSSQAVPQWEQDYIRTHSSPDDPYAHLKTSGVDPEEVSEVAELIESKQGARASPPTP